MKLTSKAGRQVQPLTIPDLVVLSLLSERPMHGYELVKEYQRQEVADWAAVSRPHVYYALKKLAAAKLIAIQRQGNQANRTVYAPTKAGHQALADGLASASWALERPPTPFLTWLGLSIHARPKDAQKVISARRAFLEQQIEKETITLAAIMQDDGMRSGVAAHMVGYVVQQFRLELDLLTALDGHFARAAK